MAESVEDRDGTIQNPARRRWSGRVLLDTLAEGILNLAAFVFGFAWWSIRWTLALVVFLAVMAGAGYYVFTRAVASGEYVTVPNISGLPMAEAAYMLSDVGLTVGPQVTKPSDHVPPYYVISQMPPAGKVVRQGRKVYPTVSKGPDFRQAPVLVGKLLEPALDVIEANRFEKGSIARIVHEEPRDTVIAQDPPPGRDVAPEAKVHLLVSQGTQPLTVYMPDLSSLNAEEARRMLAPLGVTPLVIQRVDRADLPMDAVMAQTPEAGTLISRGQTVTYEIRSSQAVPGSWRKVEYTVPQSLEERSVRIDLLPKAGRRETRFPNPSDYVRGEPPKFPQGTTIRVPFPFEDEATIEVYLDETRVRSYYYRGNQPPEIVNYGAAPAETEPELEEDVSDSLEL
ncbi:MAG: PASTA domain-containing protein [bacterium]|nr:PASTA domain-containing protein [bacterium]